MTDKEILKQIGKNIKNIRTKRGMTQLDLAAECGFEKSTLGRIEIGSTNPTVKTLFKIAKALEVNLTDLFKSK
jgi:transcriptional regulator with XRE-family HTH domain